MLSENLKVNFESGGQQPICVSKNKVVSGDGFIVCTEVKVENDDQSKLVFGQSGGDGI